MEKYDLIIVGAGPAGIFTAVELLRRGSKKQDVYKRQITLRPKKGEEILFLHLEGFAACKIHKIRVYL